MPYPADLAIGYYGQDDSKVKVSITIDIDELIAQCGSSGKVKLVGFDATVDKDGNPRTNLKDTSPHLKFIKSTPKEQRGSTSSAPSRGRTAAAPKRAGGSGYPF
jgi:hypothetical protein